ncbi:sulfotransferase [uncultured Lutibacter sp.]|uniref:sulfotransferase n=1 Tax=uncultured Lutibacter sp. TaxID=437739 RepID=UPI002628486E|nr:sulfotransferase [uncultured Lutibacter sp.]
MSTKYKNIVVTGSHRSGSTWIGKVISTNKKVDVIMEPFNLNLNKVERLKRPKLNHWFLKIDKNSLNNDITNAQKLINYYINFKLTTFPFHCFKTYENHSFIQSFIKRLKKSLRPVKMFKDPIALFSIPWLAKEFDMLPIVIIRHPAAFALSIKEKNWWFDFDNLLNQPHFFEGELAHLKEEVTAYKSSKKKEDIITNAALIWKVIYTQVAYYQSIYPQWLYVKHEALSLNPVVEFQKIFDYIGLELNSKTVDYIKKSTQSKEELEHARNSKENAYKWENKLSNQEIEKVLCITKPVYELFYKPEL